MVDSHFFQAARSDHFLRETHLVSLSADQVHVYNIDLYNVHRKTHIRILRFSKLRR